MIWAPDANTPAVGRDDCRVLVAAATENRLYVLAEVPGLNEEWTLQTAWFIRVTAPTGRLRARSGAGAESDKERSSLHAEYVIEEPLGDVLDVALEQGSVAVHQARLVRVVR